MPYRTSTFLLSIAFASTIAGHAFAVPSVAGSKSAPAVAAPTYAQARDAFRHGKDIAAISLLEDRVRQVPDDAASQSLLGYLYAKNRQWSKAVVPLQKVVALHPDDLADRNNLGMAALEAGNLDLASAQFDLIVLKNSHAAQAYAALARIALARGHADTAATLMSRSLAEKPDAVNWVNLGIMKQHAADSSGAVTAFRKAVSLDPALSAGWLNLGLSLERNGEAKQAIPALQKALDLGTTETFAAHFALGEASLQSSNAAEAAQHLQIAVALKPNSFAAQYDLAVSRMALHNVSAAEAAFSKAHALQPTDANAIVSLAACDITLKKASNAIDLLTAALKTNPESGPMHRVLAVAYQNAGQAGKAQMECKEALRINPEDAVARFNLGSAELGLHHPDQAADAFAALVKASPQDANARYWLATCREEQGKLPEAASLYQSVLQRDPNRKDARDGLIRCSGK